MHRILRFTPLLALSCTSSGPSAADILNYGNEQRACVAEADARPAADACRSKSRAVFCSKWPALQDCKDGGGQ
jgi:hypothetical protein